MNYYKWPQIVGNYIQKTPTVIQKTSPVPFKMPSPQSIQKPREPTPIPNPIPIPKPIPKPISIPKPSQLPIPEMPAFPSLSIKSVPKCMKNTQTVRQLLEVNRNHTFPRLMTASDPQPLITRIANQLSSSSSLRNYRRVDSDPNVLKTHLPPNDVTIQRPPDWSAPRVTAQPLEEDMPLNLSSKVVEKEVEEEDEDCLVLTHIRRTSQESRSLSRKSSESSSDSCRLRICESPEEDFERNEDKSEDKIEDNYHRSEDNSHKSRENVGKSLDKNFFEIKEKSKENFERSLQMIQTIVDRVVPIVPIVEHLKTDETIVENNEKSVEKSSEVLVEMPFNELNVSFILFQLKVLIKTKIFSEGIGRRVQRKAE